MLREGVIACGLVLLVLGAVLFLGLGHITSEYESFLGQLARTFLPSYQRRYAVLVSVEAVAGGIALVGVVLCIVGAVTMKGKGDIPPAPALIPKLESSFCMYCGTKIMPDVVYCYKCGRKVAEFS